MYIKELDTMGLIDKEKRGHGRGKGADMRLTIKPELKTTVAKSLESEPELLPPHHPVSDSVTEKTQP